MKKLTTLLTLLLLCCLVLLVACDEKDKAPQENAPQSTEATDPCAGGHTEVVDAAIASTCIKKGKTEGKHCSVCNEVLVAQNKVDALGHTEVIDAAIAPTCTAKGKTEGKHCSVCGKVLTAQKEIPIQHKLVEKICTICGERISSGLKFTSNGNGTCYVSGIGTCTDSDIYIPKAAPNGDSVTSIGKEAFRNIERITSIVLPNTITNIAEASFQNCQRLTNITIPDSVTSIERNAFYYCKNLKKIYYTGELEDWCNISFDYNPTSNGADLYMNNVLVTDVKIPDSVTIINDRVFTGCTSLTSVTIPDGVTSIGAHSFHGCTSLTSITIPRRVTYTGLYAFDGCTSLTSVTISDGVKIIGYSSFAHCTNLASIAIPRSVTRIEEDAFFYCTSLTSVTIPNSVTSINDNAFWGCDIQTVYYTGTAEQWATILFGWGESALTGATIYYYSETQPTTTGNYWHYVDGVPTIWK